MKLPLRVVLAAACLSASALAQQDLHARLLPITAPIRHAGVYRVATGTWVRHASLANVTGPDTIYNNTCASAYFTRMTPTEAFQHRSRLPSTTGPTTPSVYYGTSRHDEVPGSLDAYLVNGFQIAYCSSATTTVDWRYDFADSCTTCGTNMGSNATVLATGLPGGSPTGGQHCWIIDIDVSGIPGGGILLSADGDGTYVGPSSVETFGWSFSQNQALSAFTGPLVAGDYTWTGGAHSGPLTPCTGTDGTIWDNPINLNEEGTGMSSTDLFRDAATPGPVSAPSGPGCYYFGGNPHADFWLELYADPGSTQPNPLTPYCFPGEGGIHACTTCVPANPPSAHGRGCDNYGQTTGGAALSAAGFSRVSHDTVVFTSSFENNTSFTILLQGTTTSNTVFGAGIRCASGLLKRLYLGNAGSAANGDAAGMFHRPGPADPTSVHAASLAKGYDIAAHAPVTLYYLAYYRDPGAAAHCGAAATFNASQSGSISWIQ
jgi:hypothetical protein